MGTRPRNATLRRERLDRGLTVEEAAAEMDVKPDLLSRAESGKHKPRAGSAYKIASFYGFKPSEIWPIEDSDNNSSKGTA